MRPPATHQAEAAGSRESLTSLEASGESWACRERDGGLHTATVIAHTAGIKAPQRPAQRRSAAAPAQFHGSQLLQRTGGPTFPPTLARSSAAMQGSWGCKDRHAAGIGTAAAAPRQEDSDSRQAQDAPPARGSLETAGSSGQGPELSGFAKRQGTIGGGGGLEGTQESEPALSPPPPSGSRTLPPRQDPGVRGSTCGQAPPAALGSGWWAPWRSREQRRGPRGGAFTPLPLSARGLLGDAVQTAAAGEGREAARDAGSSDGEEEPARGMLGAGRSARWEQ